MKKLYLLILVMTLMLLTGCYGKDLEKKDKDMNGPNFVHTLFNSYRDITLGDSFEEKDAEILEKDPYGKVLLHFDVDYQIDDSTIAYHNYVVVQDWNKIVGGIYFIPVAKVVGITVFKNNYFLISSDVIETEAIEQLKTDNKWGQQIQNNDPSLYELYLFNSEDGDMSYLSSLNSFGWDFISQNYENETITSSDVLKHSEVGNVLLGIVTQSSLNDEFYYYLLTLYKGTDGYSLDDAYVTLIDQNSSYYEQFYNHLVESEFYQSGDI